MLLRIGYRTPCSNVRAEKLPKFIPKLMRQLHQNKRATFLGSPPRDLSKHVQNKTLLFGRFQSRWRPCCPSYRHSSRFGCLPTALAAAPNAARDIAFRTSSQNTIFISDRPCRDPSRPPRSFVVPLASGGSQVLVRISKEFSKEIFFLGNPARSN